ncbi:MAG: hypothetical protein V1794_01560 [Candidatus Glassbacteria bacterium]
MTRLLSTIPLLLALVASPPAAAASGSGAAKAPADSSHLVRAEVAVPSESELTALVEKAESDDLSQLYAMADAEANPAEQNALAHAEANPAKSQKDIGKSRQKIENSQMNVERKLVNVEEKREKHEERIYLFRLWRIMEDVGLTDQQVDQFFPLMRQLQNREKDLAQTRRELLEKLDDELQKEKPADTELKRIMELVKDNYRQTWEARVDIMNQTEKILTVQQQAKLMLSLSRVERDIWDSIARVRHFPVPDININREQLEKNMENLRENLERLKKELEAQGISPDIDINLGPRQPKEPPEPPKEH